MENSKVAYLVLKNLYKGTKLSHQELGISNKDYAEILELMQEKNLITRAKAAGSDSQRMLINSRNAEITAAGINYLMENVIPDHAYNLLVSVDETVNGIELSATVNINGRENRYKKLFSKPLTDIDIETEAFVLAAEGLKLDKENTKHAV